LACSLVCLLACLLVGLLACLLVGLFALLLVLVDVYIFKSHYQFLFFSGLFYSLKYTL
jgi:uncharacterized membrane protein YjjP (DUF1212 family)